MVFLGNYINNIYSTYSMLSQKGVKAEINKAIIKRLANYHYAEEQEGMKLLGKRKKPPFQKHMEKWLKEDPQGKIHTPNKTYAEGWVFLDHIEREPCPYKYPQSHRYQHLNPLIDAGIIEKAEFLLFVKKEGQKNRSLYRPKVYRLSRTKKAQKTIFKLLENDIDFQMSDYALHLTDSEPKTTRELQARASMIEAAVSKIVRDGYPKDKEFYEGLFGAIDRLKESLKGHYETAVYVPEEERRKKFIELAKKRNEEFFGKTKGKK